MEEIELYLDDAKDQMAKALGHVSQEITKIRAGKANPSMLDGSWYLITVRQVR